MLGDLAAKDHGDFVGLTDGAVGVQESLPQGIEGGSAMENEIIAILDLSKEEAMLAAGLFALLFRKEGSEAIQPHSAPVAIVDVEVVLNDPALSQLQVPVIILFVPDRGKNAGWFSRL